MHPLEECLTEDQHSHGIVTWDADIVLTFLKKWSPAANLSLPQLALKVVLLCLLVSGQRGQALWLLDLCSITWSKTDIRCTFGDLKTSAPNRHQDKLVFGSFPEDKSLYVVHYLRHYEKRTHALKGSEAKLFISWKAPHSVVSRDTLRRWIKMGLKTAGIDMSRFTAHLTRSASTSKAVHKLPLATILKTVGWRCPSTFATFYKKPICERNAFQNAVLSQTEDVLVDDFVCRVCQLVQMLQSLKSHVISHSSWNCGR